MTSRLLVPLFTALFLLALSALAAACGDDGELSLEDYFRQVEAVAQDADQRTDALQDDFPTAFEDPAATRDFLDAHAQIFADAAKKGDDIDPPAVAEDAHKELFAAVAGVAQLDKDLVDQLADVESTSELDAVFQRNESELDAAVERFDTACSALQTTADDNGIVVDLACE